MKIFMTIAFALATSASFAEGRPATKSEVRKLCNGVDKMLERQSADAAVDMQKCLRTKMRALYDIEGTTIVGTVPFNTPNNSSTQTCQGVVRGNVVKLVTCYL